MKIWFLTNEYPPFYGGGIATYVQTCARMLAEAGHQVTVFVNDQKMPALELNGKLRIIRVLMNGALESLNFSLNYFYELADILAKAVIEQIKIDGAAPDIIESQDSMGIAYYLLQKKLLSTGFLEHIPIVVHLHTPLFEVARANRQNRFNFNNYFMFFREKSSILSAGSLICPSNFLKKQLESILPVKKVEVMPLPLPYFDRALPASEDVPPKNDLLFFGRLEYRKGIVQFIEQAAQLWEAGQNFSLTVVGKDMLFEPKRKFLGQELRQTYQKHVTAGRLQFIDQLSPPDLYKLILGSKIVLIPSTYENFPYSCVEAMALGKPILCSAGGGQAEMVGTDGSCGMVFDWSITDDLKIKLQAMLDKSDTELKNMGQQARVKIETLCSREQNAAARIKYYTEVIKSEKPVKVFPFVNNPIPGDLPALKDSRRGFITVVVILNNEIKNLLPTVRSILTESYEEKELLIIDNASSDPQAKSVLAELEKSALPKLQIFSLPQTETAGFVRRFAAERARGEYICFLDPGVIIAREYFSKVKLIFDRYKNIYFVYSLTDSSGEIASGFQAELPLLFLANLVTPGAVLNKACFIKYGLNAPELDSGFEDYETALRLVLAGFNGVCLPEELVCAPRAEASSVLDLFPERNMKHIFQKILASGDLPGNLLNESGLDLLNIIFSNSLGRFKKYLQSMGTTR